MSCSPAFFSTVIASVWVPPVIYLHRVGVPQVGGPTNVPFSAANWAVNGGTDTGVMVLNTTASSTNGSGAFTAPTSLTNLVKVSLTGGNGLAVYEILFADPFSTEQADVPIVVSYTANLTSNPPIGLPVVGQPAKVVGSYAPFYPGGAAQQPQTTTAFPVPRFTNLPATPLTVFQINKCACNLLFPFVTSISAGGQSYDTGIAIANTSLDPGIANGFGFAQAQTGTITFYYYGETPTGAALNPQTSNLVPAGQVLTYDLFSGGGVIGATNGAGTTATFANPAAAAVVNFQGYIIAQAQFQYCHGFAFLSNLGNPSGGISEGYLGLIMDPGLLPRTVSIGETLGN